jgi:hypothetical protein
MRGDGACGRDGVIGAAGFVATGADGGAVGGAITEVGAATWAMGGIAAGEWAGRAGVGIAGGAPADAGG